MMMKMTTTKVKTPPEDLIYDVDNFFLRAACVCVRDETESEILLVSSPGKPGRWIVPGGKIQANEKAEVSAMREATEEAGAVGQLGRCLGIYDNLERKHRTKVFVLRVTQLLDCYEDSARRKRRWYPVDEAFKLLSTCKPQHSCYLASLATSKQLAGAAAAAATAATSPPQAAINNTCCGPAVAATSNPEEADRENG